MLYLGGKGRLGKTIAQVILSTTQNRGDYYEPFIGGGNSFAHIAPSFACVHAGDVHEDLMLLYRAVADGWDPPGAISEEQYRELRRAEPSALRGFAGFGCSFGGKWFGGYARSKKCAANYYADHTRRTLLRLRDLLIRSVLKRCSFDEWDVSTESVVYADPPYAGTTGYKSCFDHSGFWECATRWSDRGSNVFVSEYKAPSDWYPIWSAGHVCKVSGGTGAMTTERLFVHKSRIPHLTL